MASLMMIVRVLVITNFRGGVVGRVSKWIIIKCRSFGKKGSEMGNEISDAFFPQTYEEASWNNTGDHASSSLQKFKHLLCIQLGLVVAHLCPWRLNDYLPNVVIVPLQHMLLDPANGSTTDLGTQIQKWGVILDHFLAPIPRSCGSAS